MTSRPTIDSVFPPEHSDFELGDRYEQEGMTGVMKLTAERKGVEPPIIPPDGGFGFAALIAYYMGQVR